MGVEVYNHCLIITEGAYLPQTGTLELADLDKAISILSEMVI